MNELDKVAGALGPETERALAAWLGTGPDGALSPDALLADHERAATGVSRPDRDDPQAIRTVGVIGGGTAGYMTALALKAKRPWLDVSLVESADIPIIGVGESTVSYMVPFLHHYLGIDADELYRKVRPTWKLGIRFDWGPHPDGFMAPFDWGSNSVGTLGSLKETGTINEQTLQAMLMTADRTPVYEVEGRTVSLMKYLPFSYHLNNAPLVRYLTEVAAERGITHVDATVAEATLDADDRVSGLRTTDGRELRFDFYVDCTGFRSLLLGKALGTPFESYASSLHTDSAVTGELPHGGHIKPYTTATTMNAGWCWNIPTQDEDHLGYVFSSAAIPDDQAVDELTRRFPGVRDPRFVRFRSGRHERAWRGNVMAIGNSYAFVEPLESTGLLMIANSIQTLLSLLPASWSAPDVSEVANNALGRRWDAIRWFLSIHYRFNSRLDTPFWKEARETVDISGFQAMVNTYAAAAPLTHRDAFTQHLALGSAPTFFGLAGIDTLLLGQQVPSSLISSAEPHERWLARRDAARALTGRGMPQKDALAAFTRDPRLNRELLQSPDSWTGRAAAAQMGLA